MKAGTGIHNIQAIMVPELDYNVKKSGSDINDFRDTDEYTKNNVLEP